MKISNVIHTLSTKYGLRSESAGNNQLCVSGQLFSSFRPNAHELFGSLA